MMIDRGSVISKVTFGKPVFQYRYNMVMYAVTGYYSSILDFSENEFRGIVDALRIKTDSSI